MAVVSSRYASAYADVILDRKISPPQAVQELNSILGILNESAALRSVWENPAIPGDQKRALLDAIAAKLGLSRPTRNFLAVLIDHRRIQLFGEIVADVQHEIDRRLGFAEAEITSARDLNENEKRTLERQIENMTGKKVRAQYQRDRQLIGGAVVRLGSTVYDGSVRGQLEKLKEQLSS
jgi:F-type H+-transporting ATPase subunit delta